MAVVSGAGFRGEILGAIENARTPYGDQTKTVSVKGDATTNEGSSPRWTWRAMDPFDRLNAQSPDSDPHAFNPHPRRRTESSATPLAPASVQCYWRAPSVSRQG